MAIIAKKTIPYNFSEKHMNYIRRCRECVYNVAEGAVRAGKTVDNVIAFCKELRDTPDKLHLATASTAATAKLIIGDCNGFGLEHYFRGQCRWGKHDGNDALIIRGKFTGGKKKIVMFVGGGKSNSYTKFRGASIGMWIATEIDLHHENTITEAFNRQGAAKRQKVFWDLNPGSPFAPIYKKYIDEFAKKDAEGTLLGDYNYGHFTIFDNINISDENRAVFISRFNPQSVEYKRYIKGDRCVAEGLIFQQFADNPKKFIVEQKYNSVKFISIGVDFGGNQSKTTFVASAIIGNYQKLGVIADYKMSGGKGTVNPDRINRELIMFYKYVHTLYPNARIRYIDCDNASQELTNGIRLAFMRANIPVVVRDCWKGLINDRIYALNGLMTQGRFFVHEDCQHVIDSLSSQAWDSTKPTEDVRLDNGTFDIDTSDALEYSFSHFINLFNIFDREVIE